MVTAVGGERRTIALERQGDFERWRLEQLGDPRLAPLVLMERDIRHRGMVSEQTWSRFDNEKYSRTAERLTEAHHERPDYYPFDEETGDIIITESDGVKPRYTLRDVYYNGLLKSRETAANDPRFAFQLQRDEIFMQTYEQVETMMYGETDHDTIVMVSTFPIELLHTDPQALKQKFYDLKDGKQFEYVFQRIALPNGKKILGMGASSLYSPQEDLQMGTHYGRASLAAVQRSHGVNVPYNMVSSHKQNSYTAAFNSGGQSVQDIMAHDAKTYDAALFQLTHLESDHGRTDTTIDAYTLFDHCQNDWAAYKAYYEMLARHLAGQPLNDQLRDHLLNLLSDYKHHGKTNTAVSEEGMNRLFTQVWHGRITPEMQLACNEIMDYAHSALMYRYLSEYKQTGRLPVQTATGDVLADYSSGSGEANGGAVGAGMDFSDCEDGNGVSDMSAAAALAEQTGMTFEEALNVIKKKNRSTAYNASLAEKYGAQNVYLGQCGACGSHGEIGPCGPGFCNDCDTRDRIDRGYILRMYQRRNAGKSRLATAKYGEKASLPSAAAKPMEGRRVRTELRMTVGGAEEVIIDDDTGLEVSSS